NKEGEEQFELGPINGKEIISCGPCFEDGMLWIRTEDNQEGFVNTSGVCTIEPIYDEVGPFYNNRALVLKDNIWSVINKRGDNIFTFNKKMSPIEGWAMNKTSPRSSQHKINQIFLKDSEGRFYMFDAKGELTKLSPKIKKIEGYYDNNIIYRSDSYEMGMMSLDGEIAIRPKYKQLSFGAKGELIGSYKANEWELLDYSGSIITKLDFSDVNFIKHFGYIGWDKSCYTIINKDGQPFDKNLNFVNFSQVQSLGLGHSRYVPSAKIIETVMDMLTPDGVSQYKFGESMKSIALAHDRTIESVLYEYSLPLYNKRYGNYAIGLNAVSHECIAYYTTNWLRYNYVPNWNLDSKIECFVIFVQTYDFTLSQWEKGIKEFEEILKQNGYKETQREVTSEIPAILMSNNDKSIIIGMNNKDIVLAYIKNSKVLENFILNEFKVLHTEVPLKTEELMDSVASPVRIIM
ncbi:MAG: WG repeat-containing protein, partial [Bacteroidales bacterium]|nr:WG repeat-containing protein [Bacteroidales bacterium]